MDFDRFVFERVLNEGEHHLKSNYILDKRRADPVARSVILLGSLKPTASDISDAAEAKPAIVRIERTALPSFSDGLISTTKLIETTDIVSSLSLLSCLTLSPLTTFLVPVCVDARLAEPFGGQARRQDQCHLSCY
jgi:hypothetical protein